MRKVTYIFDRLLSFSGYGAGALLVFAAFIITLEVILRHFGYPQSWVLETSEYILLFVTFLAAAWLLRIEGHISMDLVPNAIKPRAAAMLNVVTSALGAGLCLALTYYGAERTWYHFQEGLRTFTALELPAYPFLASIPAGFFLLSMQFLRRTSGYLRTWRLGQGKGQER